MISVGSSRFDRLDPSCPSAGQSPQQIFASYFAFSHSGGPLLIELHSDHPNSYDPYLYLRRGEGRDGTVLAEDDDTAGAARGSRMSQSNLPAGRYTIEATSYYNGAAPVQGAFGLSVYGSTITANPTGKLNDTGINFAGVSLTDNSSICNGSLGFAKQDCNQGRDGSSQIGFGLAGNADDGAGGFSFLKVGPNGQPLPEIATQWSCVKDNVTGLMWEVKTDINPAGPHDKDSLYTWFNPDNTTNGGNSGDSGTSGTCSLGTGALCNTFSFPFFVNLTGLCGYQDWRVPTVSELFGLMHLSVGAPRIPQTLFPNTAVDLTDYWSSTPGAGNSIRAQAVNFSAGGAVLNNKSDAKYIRLVRGNN